MITAHEKYLLEKAKLDSRFTDKQKIKISKAIREGVKKNRLKNVGEFWNIQNILSIPESKHFPFIVITGDRNLGKSYSLREYIVNKYNTTGRRAIWMRTLQKSADDQMLNAYEYFDEKGWGIYSKNSEIVLPKMRKAKDKEGNEILEKPTVITKSTIDDTVMWFKGLKTSATSKSVEYPKTDTIIFDEFNDGIPIKNKMGKLASFASTVFRHNQNAKIFLMANYIDQGDNILTSLGMKQAKGVVPEITINWTIPAIIWNIPKGFYQKTGSNDLLSRRISIAAGYKSYKQEYGGEFENETNFNIKPLTEFSNKKQLAYIYIGGDKYIYGRSTHNQDCGSIEICKGHNDFYIVDYEKLPTSKNLPEYVFTNDDNLRHKNAVKLTTAQYMILRNSWKKEKLWTDEIAIAEIMIQMLATDKSQEKKLVSELK